MVDVIDGNSGAITALSDALWEASDRAAAPLDAATADS
jgi:hypothetical protein